MFYVGNSFFGLLSGNGLVLYCYMFFLVVEIFIDVRSEVLLLSSRLEEIELNGR